MDNYRKNVKLVQEAVDQKCAFLQPDPFLVQHVLSAANEKGEVKVKKRISVGLVFALALVMLTSFSAVAAVLDWNVLEFLFGSQNHAAKILVQPVNICSTDGQVTLSVDSAITDGDNLALDWSIVNEKPDIPVYILVDEFTVNGERVWTDGNDEFDSCWLPGPFGKDGEMQGGEITRLPETIRASDTLEVVLRADVYYPKLPVYTMDEYDAELAEKKVQEGYLVVPEGEGYVAQDADGIYWAAGPIPANMTEYFTRTTLEIAFALSTEAGRASVQQLQVPEPYENEYFIARYTKAEVSLIGLTLHLELDSPDAEYSFELTDEQGNALEANCYSEFGTATTNGNMIQVFKGTWYGLTWDMLPDVISLTCYPSNDDPVILPVQVR